MIRNNMQSSRGLAENKFQDFPRPENYFPGPCRSPQQRVNIKTNSSYLLYIQQRDRSIHTAMFITVTCSEENVLSSLRLHPSKFQDL